MAEAAPSGLAPKWKYLIAAAPLLVALDQITKIAVFHRFAPGQKAVLLPGWLQLVRVHNTGMAFGQLRQMPAVFFIGLSVAAFGVLLALFRDIRPNQRRLSLAVAFVFSGAVGNLIDRIRLGYVIDFIDMFVVRGGRAHHWPAYNVADIAIVAGAALLGIEMWPRPGEAKAEKRESPPVENGPAEGAGRGDGA